MTTFLTQEEIDDVFDLEPELNLARLKVRMRPMWQASNELYQQRAERYAQLSKPITITALMEEQT
jgi:hypothetical protein